jgi:Flp pilus assembly protein TadD
VKAWTVVPVALAAAVAGFLAGRAASGPGAQVPLADLERVERERDEALARVRRAEMALDAARAPGRSGPAAPREPAGPGGGASTVATPASAGAGTPPDPARAEPTDAAREAQVRELVAQIDGAFELGDGEVALSLLRRLSALAPEGRQATMDLAVRINADLYGDGVLRLDQVGFHRTLGDTDLRNLMLWSLEHESPADFRVLAAASLPWVVPPERAVELLGKALASERQVSVQAALVSALSQMNDSRAQALLASVLADRERDAGVRAQVVTAIALSADPEVLKAVQSAAASDPDEGVRAAARAALVARDPPADGYLVTIVLPDGTGVAAGLLPGDIVLTYDGKPARDLREMRAAMDAATAAAVPVVVLRDGAERTLEIRRGRMGVQGRPVRKR